MEQASTKSAFSLRRLCQLSFANQGLMMLVYLVGLFVAIGVRSLTTDEVASYVSAQAREAGAQDRLPQLLRTAELFRTSGIWLMLAFTLRTFARFLGVLGMWRGKASGFHIYTLAQLLGMVPPLLILGPQSFEWMGLIAVLLWCLMYWIRMREAGFIGGPLKED